MRAIFPYDVGEKSCTGFLHDVGRLAGARLVQCDLRCFDFGQRQRIIPIS